MPFRFSPPLAQFRPFASRACVGRNLAILELQMIVASLLRRYEFVLENPDEEVSFLISFFLVVWLISLQLETREGFLRKPLRCHVGIKRREL